MSRDKVTEDYIESRIKEVRYIKDQSSTVTVCAITMVNGFSAIGYSACVDPKNFDEDKGKSIAYENAFNQLWPLEGYLLKEEMYQASKNQQ